LTTDDCVGGALWIPSEKAKIGFIQQLCLLPNMIRAVSLCGLKRLIGLLNAMERAHPIDFQHYISNKRETAR
jgi:hypothetical protein